MEAMGQKGADKRGWRDMTPRTLWHLCLHRYLDTQGAPKTEQCQCQLPAALAARSFTAQAAAAGAIPLLLPKLGAQDQPPN